MATPEVGDLFQSNDPRDRGRIVKVVEIGSFGAIIENVEHWDEKRVGRRTRTRAARLTWGGTRGFTKVSH